MKVEELLKKIFPISYGFVDNLTNLIIGLVIYVVGGFLIGLVLGVVGMLLGIIPFVGTLLGILGSLVGVYSFVGIVLQLLVYFKVLK